MKIYLVKTCLRQVFCVLFFLTVFLIYLIHAPLSSAGLYAQTLASTENFQPLASGPKIISFTAAQSPITAGSSTTLTAVFSNGTGTINQNVGKVVSGMPCKVRPYALTTYTLTVKNNAGRKVSKTVTVAVVTSPSRGFIAAPAAITIQREPDYDASIVIAPFHIYNWGITSPGQISWISTDKRNITFFSNVVSTLILSCSIFDSSKGTSSKSWVEIKAVAPPEVESFIVAATHFPIQNGTTLNAVFSNGLGVVNPGNLRIISGAPLPIKPAMMTRYTLIVTNAAGSKCIANATAYPAIPVAAGLNHCIARKSDGTVWTWGHNMRGQLGDGTNQDRNTPGIVNNFSDVVAVTSGEDQSFSIKNEGSVWAWGFNECGQLGDGTSNNQKLPVKVINLPPRVVALAATFLDTRAIIDKTIWIWGHSATIFPTPTNQENVVAISTYPTIALYDDGTVNVPNGEDLRNLSAVAATYNSYFALKNDGTIWEWDINNKPAQKPGFTDIVAIAGGFYHKLALKSDGTVWGWGDNSCGQLGDGTTTPRQDPVKANGLDNIVAIAASIYGYFSIAIKNDGTVWGWGNNLYGSLGDGTNTDHYIPVQIPNFKLW